MYYQTFCIDKSIEPWNSLIKSDQISDRKAAGFDKNRALYPVPLSKESSVYKTIEFFFLADLWFFHFPNIIKFLTVLNEVDVKEIVGAGCCCGYSVILFSMLFVPFGRGRIMYAFIIIREEYSMLIFPRVSFSITQGFFSSWETSSRKAIEGFPSSFHNLIFNFPPLLQKANSLWLKVNN